MTDILSMVTEFGALSLVLAGAVVLGKYFLTEKQQDKNSYREDLQAKDEIIMKQFKVFQDEISDTRDLYREELARDREVYVQSMQVVYKDISCIREDINELKIIVQGDITYE